MCTHIHSITDAYKYTHTLFGTLMYTYISMLCIFIYENYILIISFLFQAISLGLNNIIPEINSAIKDENLDENRVSNCFIFTYTLCILEKNILDSNTIVYCNICIYILPLLLFFE